MNETSPKATDCVTEWIGNNRTKLGTELSFVRQDENGETLCAQYETPEHLIELCAWNQSFCLDIIALSKASGTYSYTVAGPCDNAKGLFLRLEAFSKWLDAQ